MELFFFDAINFKIQIFWDTKKWKNSILKIFFFYSFRIYRCIKNKRGINIKSNQQMTYSSKNDDNNTKGIYSRRLYLGSYGNESNEC